MKTSSYILALVLTISSFSLSAQTQTIDTETSTISWLGKKIGGQHEGLIQLKSAVLKENDGKIVSGSFVIDMTSITNTDLADMSYNQKLVGHLKSDDFFGVEKFPTASLNIIRATQFSDGKATITGDLTIKGKTETITFDIVKNVGTYTAKLEIDRSKFDVRYGSTSFFERLGDKAIDDIFVLNIKLLMK